MSRTCPECGAVLPAGVRAEFCPVCAFRDAREPTLVTEVLGDYELLEEIGRGGMRSVARDSAARTHRGVKCPRRDFASESARDVSR